MDNIIVDLHYNGGSLHHPVCVYERNVCILKVVVCDCIKSGSKIIIIIYLHIQWCVVVNNNNNGHYIV